MLAYRENRPFDLDIILYLNLKEKCRLKVRFFPDKSTLPGLDYAASN